MSDFDIAQATRGMLDRTLYVALSQPRVPRAELAGQLAAHLQFMIALEAEGVLFASGPFFAPDASGEDGKASTGEGLTIVRARSLDEARAILERDPFVVAGMRSFTLHEWHLMEGALQLTVLASQRRGLVP